MAHPRSDRGDGLVLVLQRNLLALHHLLDYALFVAAVVLDRLGIVSFEGEMLAGEPWIELVDTAAMERLMEAAFWEPSSSLMKKRSSAAPQYRRRLRVARAEDSEADDDEGGEVVCAICLDGLDVGGHRVTELCNCSHAFHAACIVDWIAGGEAGTCPLCRTPAMASARSVWLA